MIGAMAAGWIAALLTAYSIRLSDAAAGTMCAVAFGTLCVSILLGPSPGFLRKRFEEILATRRKEGWHMRASSAFFACLGMGLMICGVLTGLKQLIH